MSLSAEERREKRRAYYRQCNGFIGRTRDDALSRVARIIAYIK